MKNEPFFCFLFFKLDPSGVQTRVCTFSVLLRVLIRCSLSFTLWFLQRFMKEALNSLLVDGLRCPVGERLASLR